MRSWPREGEEARRGETDGCRRLLSRPRSSTSGSTIVGRVSYALAVGAGTATPERSETVVADIWTVGRFDVFLVVSFNSAVKEDRVKHGRAEVRRHQVCNA